MAAIQGQPQPKPSDLKSPVPQTDPFADLADPFAGLGESAPAIETQEPQGYTGFGSGALQTVADYAPAALGLAGAAIAGPALPVVAGMAMAGAAAGVGYRRLIEQNILKTKRPEDQSGNLGLTEATDAAGAEGLSTAVGAGLVKGTGALAKSKFGQAFGEEVAQIAEKPVKYVKGIIETARVKIQEPIAKLVAEKGSQLDAEAAGDFVKKKFVENVTTKYGAFKNAHETLTEVSQQLPLADSSRYKLTQKLKAWAMDKSGDEYKLVKKFADSLDASDNGARFLSEVDRLNQTIGGLQQASDTQLAATLKEARDMASDFFESEVTRLAGKIKAGKASPEETGFIQRAIQSRGIQEPDPTKYAKSIASDYLKSVDSVRGEYSTFRKFLEDIGEQTGTKSASRSKGPMAFLENLREIPSEKLVERMFDPKNAAALRKLQQQNGEIFDTVVKTKFQSLVNEATPAGSTLPDYFKLRQLIKDLPDSTRSFIVTSKDRKVMDAVLSSKRLQSLDYLEKIGEKDIIKTINGVVEATRTVGGQVSKDASNTQVGRQVIGKGATGLAGAFLPGISQAPPEQP